MATRKWVGDANGSWAEASNWSPADVPQPGDTAVITTAIAAVQNLALDDLTIQIGSTDTDVQAGVAATGGVGLGSGTTLSLLGGTTGYFDVQFTVTIDGTVEAVQAGSGHGTFDIGGTGDLAIESDGQMTVASGNAMSLSVTTTNDGVVTIGRGGALTNNGSLQNNGTIVVDGGSFDNEGTIYGEGTITLANGGSFEDDAVVSPGQSVAFLDATGVLSIQNPADFSGTVTALQPGDVINLFRTDADAASVSNGVLTATLGGQTVATINVGPGVAPLGITTRYDGFGTLLLTSNATRTWTGGDGSWTDPANWTAAGTGATGAPLAGDTVLVGAGTATLGGSAGSVYATSIHLQGSATAPGTLLMDEATLDKSTSLVVDGKAQDGRVEFAGTNVLGGSMTASSIGGSLTLDLASQAGANTLTVGQKAAIVAGQGAAIAITGGTLANGGNISAYGTITIDASVSLADASGLFQIDNGGTLVIEGAIGASQQIIFGDVQGRLEVGDIGGFAAAVESFQQGDVIELLGVAVTSIAPAPGGFTVTYGPDNATATFSVGTETDGTGTFQMAPDGKGGTNITFVATDPILLDASMPVAAVGTATQMVPFTTILTNAFGSVPTGYASYTFNARTNAGALSSMSYWGQSQQDPPATGVLPGWYMADSTTNEMKPIANGTQLGMSQLSSVYYEVGNCIVSTAEFTVAAALNPDGSVAENLTYHMWSVDPSVSTYVPGLTVPNATTQTSSIAVYNQVYDNVLNTDDCPWIADDVAAGAGATMPWQNVSTDPAANQEGGFWRIAYRGTTGSLNDWYTQIRAGDVVRMGWAGLNGQGTEVGHHTTSIYQVVGAGPDTVALVWDNNDFKNDGNVDYIGLHQATYWDATTPETVTVYRLDPAQQYLIQGSGGGEFIQGSVFNNLIQPGGGGDTIAAGAGRNEIQGAIADLQGDAVTDFHAGDWLDITDLAPDGASASYDADDGMLTVGNGVQTVSLTLMAGLAGPFATASDGNGGTVVSVACYARGTRIAVPGGEAAVEDLAIGDRVLTGSGEACPVRWIGRRSYGGRFLAANPALHPVRIRAGALGGGLPCRDLFVSPEHAMLVDGLLIPARCLVNGSTIVPERRLGRVDYFHVELDRHNVLFAEGAPSESFLDEDSRGMFGNAAEFTALYPDAPPAGRFCAPRVEAGPELEAVRRRLAGLPAAQVA